jgi:hypothetical protein
MQSRVEMPYHTATPHVGKSEFETFVELQSLVSVLMSPRNADASSPLYCNSDVASHACQYHMHVTGLCSLDGRHLCMMPHPERVFLVGCRQWNRCDGLVLVWHDTAVMALH